MIEDALAAKDLSLFADDIAAISGMPPVIAAPIWFNSKDIYYYWQENGNIVPSPAPRTKLPRVPDGYRVRISGVALDTVKAYQQELAAAGLTLMKTSTENEIACQYGDSVFAITWDNGTVTILAFEGPVCFVPRWYLPVLNSQKH